LPDFAASAFWGGPVGHDPVILAELTESPELAWFHLDQQQRRPFPVPGVGLVALGEHHEPFDRRVGRARLYVGLSVWAAVMLEREIEAGEWWLTRGTADDIFATDPDGLLKRPRPGTPSRATWAGWPDPPPRRSLAGSHATLTSCRWPSPCTPSRRPRSTAGRRS
jgi:hypothetical protein